MLRDSGAAHEKDCELAATINDAVAKERQPIIVQCFNAPCGARPAKHPKDKDGVIVFRRHQEACFQVLSAPQFCLMVMPMGSGKTIAMMGLALDDLARTGRKQLIVYPTRDIAPNFGGPGCDKPVTIEIPGRGPMRWTPRHAPDDVVETLIEFFLKPPAKDRARRILICTHQALALADQEIRRRGYEGDHFAGTSLYIDEAHHCGWGDARGDKPRNRIAVIVRHYVEHQSGKLTLVTATFMRGDGEILPGDVRGRFVRYDYAVPDYMEACRYLKGMRIHFVLGSYEEAFDSVIRNDPTAVTIGWTPPALYKSQKRTLVKALVRKVPAAVRARTLDLTNLNTRETVRAQFHATKLDPARCPLLTIVHNMLLEGGDAPLAHRGIMIGPRANVGTVLQMIGRLLRDVKGKTHVDIYIIIPRDNCDEPVPKDQLEDYLSAMLVALVAGWAFAPSPFKPRTAKQKRIQGEVRNALGNPENAHDILMGMSHEIAKHSGDAAQLDDALHGVLLRAADAKPELAGQKDPDVRKATIKELQERLREPTRQAERAMPKNSFKGARHLIGLELTEENVLGRFLQAYGYQCGYRSLQAMRDALAKTTVDLTLQEITTAVMSEFTTSGNFPNRNTVGGVSRSGTILSWMQIDGRLRGVFSSSLVNLQKELTGYRIGDAPTDQQVVEEAERYQEVYGELPSDAPRSKCRPFGDWPISWGTISGQLRRRGFKGITDFLTKMTVLDEMTLPEWLTYVRVTSIPGFDIRRKEQYAAAAAAGLLDPRCPRQPARYFARRGEWPGWCFLPRPRGTQTNRSNLTDAKVRRIRQQAAKGIKHRLLAQRYGVSQPTVSKIARGAGWVHVK